MIEHYLFVGTDSHTGCIIQPLNITKLNILVKSSKAIKIGLLSRKITVIPYYYSEFMQTFDGINM